MGGRDRVGVLSVRACVWRRVCGGGLGRGGSVTGHGWLVGWCVRGVALSLSLSLVRWLGGCCRSSLHHSPSTPPFMVSRTVFLYRGFTRRFSSTGPAKFAAILNCMSKSSPFSSRACLMCRCAFKWRDVSRIARSCSRAPPGSRARTLARPAMAVGRKGCPWQSKSRYSTILVVRLKGCSRLTASCRVRWWCLLTCTSSAGP